MDEWKSRVVNVYGPLARDGQRRRNEIMGRIAGIPLERSRSRRGLIMKIAIPSGIAAGLLLAAGLSVMLFTNHRAIAADELQQVAKANQAYKGWIHMEVTPRPGAGTTLPAGVGPVPTRVWQHINTADGSLANVRDWDGNRTIDLYLTSRREIATYDSATGEIRIGTMMADTAKGMAETLATSPVTIAAAIAEFRKSTGRDPVEVLRKRENGADRYDVTLFKDEEEAQKLCKERGMCLVFPKITLWADPQMNLIQKMEFVQGGIQISAAFTYGKPEIKDIYDLGAPRDAKVVDNRLGANLEAVLDRLDARAAKGLGNCVAVIASESYAQLYETDANRWFVAHYRIGKTSDRLAEGTYLPAAPAGWPTPDVKQLVDALKDVAPTEYWFMGEERGWCGWARALSKSYDSRLVESKERKVLWSSLGLGGEIWPNRYSKFSWRGAKIEIVSDANRAGLLGIRCDKDFASEGRNDRQESVYWIDPAKDDMPVETTWRVYEKDRVTTEGSTKYLEYAQLPGGQWYPKRWQRVLLQTLLGRAATQPHRSDQEYHLLVVPNMRLDNEWFVNPAEKFTAKK